MDDVAVYSRLHLPGRYVYLSIPVLSHVHLTGLGLTVIAPLRCVPGNLGHSVFLIFDSLTNAFDIISVSLNIVLAAMMSIKLLSAHRLYRGLAAPTGHPGGQYLTVIGLIVESAIAWAFFGILFIVTFMTGMDESIIFRALFEATAVSFLRYVINIIRILIDLCRALTHSYSSSAWYIRFIMPSRSPLPAFRPETGSCPREISALLG
jgi:hypothetical protein